MDVGSSGGRMTKRELRPDYVGIDPARAVRVFADPRIPAGVGMVDGAFLFDPTPPVMQTVSSAPPLTNENVERHLADAVDAIRAIGPVPVRIVAPAEVLGALERAIKRGEIAWTSGPPIAAHLPIETAAEGDDLPAWTCRVEFSDGSTELVRLR
ncbi:hypothetical protein DB32_006023 [Sandaracinus amylolyticus]|uniref:Uncharacterized protein n=1 Tax=Sandaracinus amylolyticus TaxID=927083 RepID=A0A0F6SGK9_9BACT|nr:hypothetical protein DB32_006023 [Sandaracinus amylolyticus]